MRVVAIGLAAICAAAAPAASQPSPKPAKARANPTRSWLGVYVSGRRALISDVLPQTPAQRGGLKPGDVVTRVGPIDIDSSSELIATVSALKPGTEVELVVIRARSGPTKVRVVVEAKPSASQMLRRRFLGTPAKNFQLSQVGGGDISLSDLHGEVVVIEHFGSWDSACKSTFQTLTELSDRGAIVLGLSGEGHAALSRFVGKRSPPFPVLDDSVSRVQRQYETNEIPLILVIDRSGVIRHISVGAERSELDRAFDAALAALSQGSPSASVR